ncbi:unnamed protein product [Linum trigynum]|uniref:Uncharacterized protein n=1 Tax=Linum trigynum TaxID=586398 RepID=A0AAV2E4P4_9ROSI
MEGVAKDKKDIAKGKGKAVAVASKPLVVGISAGKSKGGADGSKGETGGRRTSGGKGKEDVIASTSKGGRAPTSSSKPGGQVLVAGEDVRIEGKEVGGKQKEAKGGASNNTKQQVKMNGMSDEREPSLVVAPKVGMRLAKGKIDGAAGGEKEGSPRVENKTVQQQEGARDGSLMEKMVVSTTDLLKKATMSLKLDEYGTNLSEVFRMKAPEMEMGDEKKRVAAEVENFSLDPTLVKKVCVQDSGGGVDAAVEVASSKWPQSPK